MGMQRQAQPMDRKMMREMNQNTLLNLIRAHAPISRTQLKILSGLSLGTIVAITTTLIDRQLVVETGVAESTGGRKAGLLEINPEGGYAIGINLLEHEIVAALLNLHGVVLYEETWPASLRNNATHAVEIIATGVEAFITHTGVERAKIIGLGIGISGPVNMAMGVNVDSWILNWHNVELSTPLTRRLSIPVTIDNSVKCLASYENLFGYGQQFQDFLIVTLGRGLGLAVVIRGEIFRGSQGIGAEFGHIPFNVNGRQCECGNQGCLEAYVADHGVYSTYHELRSEPDTIKPGDIGFAEINELFKRAQQGDIQARQSFELTGTYLGIGLANLVNLFNPQCIIIKGGEGNRVDLLLGPMKATMKRHVFSQLGNNLTLIVEPDTTMINWARGAGCLVLQNFFSVPTKP